MPHKDPEKRRECQRRCKAKRRLEGWRDTVRPEDKARTTNYARFVNWRRKLLWINRLGGCCAHCGSDLPTECLDFDHIDRKSKEHSISVLLSSGDEEAIEREMVKCQVLCANCHRRKTRHEEHREFYPIENLIPGDLVQISTACVHRSHAGNPNNASLKTEVSFVLFRGAVRDSGGTVVGLMFNTNIENDDRGPFKTYPLSTVLSLRFIRRRSRPHRKHQSRHFLDVKADAT